jgi:hypothetical protein
MKDRDPESIILCEGYHDRAFLSGLLEHHGCQSLKGKPYRGHKPLTGKGQYTFVTPHGGWLRLVPVDGDKNLLNAANTELIARETSALRHVVLVRDDDTIAAKEMEQSSANAPNQREALENWARHTLRATAIEGTDDFQLDAGIIPTRISFLFWCARDAHNDYLPPKQTLERLVCAAIAEAYPARCTSVADFIAARPAPPTGEKLHKSHAASHMAGWYSDRGYEGFFSAVWTDNAIRDALMRRLAEAGVKTILNELLGGNEQ